MSAPRRARAGTGDRPLGASAYLDTRHSRQYTNCAVDSFVLVLLGGVVALGLWMWLLARHYPGNGLDQVGLKSAREITERREALEAEDLDQMIAAHNARRRAKGEPEVTAAEYELRVTTDLHDQHRRREQYLADRELDELLEVTNAHRRKRGLPERTREQASEEFGSGRSAGC